MENPIEMDDFGVSKPPIFGNIQVVFHFKLTQDLRTVTRKNDAMEFVEQPELGISTENLGCTKSL